ncbi:Acyl carrier protein [Azospirillaceae bacterium]
MTDTLEKVISIIKSKATVDADKLEPSARLTDIGIASLDVVEIVFALEETFDIQIPFNANSSKLNFETIGEIAAAVEKLVAAKS